MGYGGGVLIYFCSFFDNNDIPTKRLFQYSSHPTDVNNDNPFSFESTCYSLAKRYGYSRTADLRAICPKIFSAITNTIRSKVIWPHFDHDLDPRFRRQSINFILLRKSDYIDVLKPRNHEATSDTVARRVRQSSNLPHQKLHRMLRLRLSRRFRPEDCAELLTYLTRQNLLKTTPRFSCFRIQLVNG